MIQSVRVLPRGVREVSIELVVRDEAEGRRLVENAARVMPVGPTQFIRPPWIESSSRLDDDLVLIRGSCRRRAGPRMARERLPRGRPARARARRTSSCTGPVIIEIDDLAQRRFARATSGAERG